MTSVLYVISSNKKIEGFVTASNSLPTLDYEAFIKLKDIGKDVDKLFRPKLEYLLTSIKGNTKVAQEQQYDDAGNEIEGPPPTDEVPVNSPEQRDINRFLHDLKKFDTSYYYHLLANATNTKVSDEYVL